jgi:hypothetical protein
MGTLTPADTDAFAILCVLRAAFDAASDEGSILRLANALRPYYALFGLEPVSRSRIALPPADPIEKFRA